MKYLRTLTVSLVLIAPLLLGAQDLKYKITDLGPLSQRTVDSAPWALNNAGEIGITMGTGDTTVAAYKWNQIEPQKLGVPTGGVSTVARSISNSGEVAGWVSYSFNADQATLWTVDGQPMAIPVPGTRSRALAANDQGIAVGEYFTPEGLFEAHAFMYTPSRGVTELGRLPGTTSCSANAINRLSEVTGYCYDPTDGMPYMAFLWSPASGLRALMPKVNGASVAYGLNNSGQAVGMVMQRSSWVAFVFSPATGKIRYLELPSVLTKGGYSVAFAVNDSGQIVGESNAKAFIDDKGLTTDLNTTIPSGAGWVLASALSINSNGQIVGVGTFNGERHGFLLTPETSLGTQTSRKNQKP